MHSAVIRELGLSPLWRKRAASTKVQADGVAQSSQAQNESIKNRATDINTKSLPKNYAPENTTQENVAQEIVPPVAIINTDVNIDAVQIPTTLDNDAPPQLEIDDNNAPPQLDSPPPESYADESNLSDTPFPAAGPGLSWDGLRDAVTNCERCALSRSRTNTVFGVGARDADIFFIGEGPGETEDRLGEPFVGEAGKLLDLMLASIGLARGQGVYISNIVKCRPPNNRTPRTDEAQACMSYLHRQLSLVQPKLIVALGRVAATHLLKSDAPISKLRQRLHEYNGTPLVVTYHPAYLLRTPADKSKSWEDLLHLRRVAKGE